MDKKNLKGQLTGEKAQALQQGFFNACGAMIEDFPFTAPIVKYYEDPDHDILLEMKQKGGRSPMALRVHFGAVDGRSKKIITISATFKDGFCASSRVGQGTRDEVYDYPNTSAWVDAYDEISFFLKEGHGVQAVTHREYANGIRTASTQLLKQVERALK